MTRGGVRSTCDPFNFVKTCVLANNMGATLLPERVSRATLWLLFAPADGRASLAALAMVGTYVEA